MSLLTIKIEKIGLKDAGQCIDPYMTISVKGNDPILFYTFPVSVVWVKVNSLGKRRRPPQLLVSDYSPTLVSDVSSCSPSAL